MKRMVFVLVLAVRTALVVAHVDQSSGQADGARAPIFGIKIPAGYRDWKLISVAREKAASTICAPSWAMTSPSRLAGRGSCRSLVAPSLPVSLGAISPQRKTTKPLAVNNLLWLGRRRTAFSLWSRTQQNTYRPAAGASLNSTRANPLARRCTRPVFLAIRLSTLATWSSLGTRLDSASPVEERRPCCGHR